MMSGVTIDNMIANNRSLPIIKQEVDNTTATQSYHQVCSPTTTLQQQEVFNYLPLFIAHLLFVF